MVQRPAILRYGGAMVALLLATSVRLGLDSLLGDSAPFPLFFLAIMFAAWYGGLGPGFIALALGGVVADYFFVPPRGTLWFTNHAPQEQVGVGLFYGVGIGIIVLIEKLRRETTFADIIIDGIPGLFYVLDRQGRFVRWNQREEQLTGLSADTLRGMDALLTIAMEDRELVAGKMREVFEKGQAEVEARVLSKDGILDFWLTGRRMDVGSTTYLTGSGVDITERKRAEAGLLAARHSAEQAKIVAEQANHAKDHFLAVLSHELRTPLTPVVMGVSMLQDRLDLDSQVRETLEMVHRNVEMEARLIDDLLDVTRIARGKIELNRKPVKLCTVIALAVEVCKHDIEARQLHFGVDLGPSAPYWIEADVSRLQQVFWNLLKNAIKFTPHGGCVGIRCQPYEKFVIAEVNDSGIGIEPESLSRVFNAFEQTERSITQHFGGLGLGLTITKALVEMHGGTIEAYSKGRDQGATFRIQLPMAVPLRQPEAPAPARPPLRVDRPLRILLVEDHGVTAKILQMVLSAEGHTVEKAGDVATALKLAAHDAFDLLLSDLGLPDGSGHDLMRQLRQRGYHFPGIALSGYGREEDIQRSCQAGFAAHLIKPASREAVVETIALVMGGEKPAAAVKPSATPSETLVFDVQMALKKCFGEAELLSQMIQIFFDDCETLLPQIHSAFERGDFFELGKLSHRLKGTLLHLDAKLAEEAAADVERVGLYGGEQVEAERAVRWLERECQVLKTALKEYQTTVMATQA